MFMLLRKIKSEELAEVYQMGYAAWPKGRTYKEYVRDNQKEETYGIRYVYVNEEDQIIGSFILLLLQTPRLKFALHGIGSVVVHQLYQRMGYGRDMLEDFFKKMKIEKRSAIFMLYSDILPEYYHQFGFKELPSHLQRYPQSIAMINCSESQYEYLSKQSIEDIPAYF